MHADIIEDILSHFPNHSPSSWWQRICCETLFALMATSMHPFSSCRSCIHGQCIYYYSAISDTSCNGISDLSLSSNPAHAEMSSGRCWSSWNQVLGMFFNLLHHKSADESAVIIYVVCFAHNTIHWHTNYSWVTIEWYLLICSHYEIPS